MSIQPSAINSLFGTQATPQAKNATSASEAVKPFGDLLSREMQNRQNAAAPASAAAEPATPERGPSARQRPANNVEAAGARTRQETRRAQERHAADKRQEEQNAANAVANAAPQTISDAPASRADGSATESSTADDATVADESTISVAAGEPQAGSAAAALQALVNSLAPKAAASTTGAGTEAKAAGGRGVTVVTAATAATAATAGSGVSGAAGAADSQADTSEASAAPDPAFDALLAQAAQMSQSRDAARSGAAGHATPLAADLRIVTTAAPGTAMPDATDLASAGAAMVKADANPGAAALPAAMPATDKDVLAPKPGIVAALGANILQATGTAPASGADTLSPRVGTPAWDHALGQKVVWMAAGAEQSASLMLNPPDLGPVQVVINVSNAQADASFTAAQPEVRQALEAALPKLKEMLADAGISLGQTSVGAGSPNQQGAAERQHAPGQARRANGIASADGSSTTRGESVVKRAATGGNGLVNTFA